MKQPGEKTDVEALSREDAAAGRDLPARTPRRPRGFLPHAHTHAPPLFLSPRRPPITELLKHVWNECEKDDVFGRAAQLAYYLIFSIFPMLLFLASLLAFLPIPNLLESLLGYLSRVLPVEAYRMLRGTVIEVIQNRQPGLLSLSLLVTIWSSSSAMAALINSLNIAYHVEEWRPWWQQRVLALFLTIGLAFFTILALVLIFFGGNIGERIALVHGFGSAFHLFWNFAQWPLLIGFVMFALDLIYYLAPNIELRWRWVTPGAVFAMVCWLLISFGLRFYLARFSNYNATYGSLGGVMIMMLWLYLTGLVILIGGGINSVLERFVYGVGGTEGLSQLPSPEA
ncbi:MAG TPA: YihY/virulence factor BrkB family protein [Blastocatellia bacterium]|nr:YihY/virulence factor BrkB family protein [Blastocatellia bacterium]